MSVRPRDASDKTNWNQSEAVTQNPIDTPPLMPTAWTIRVLACAEDKRYGRNFTDLSPPRPSEDITHG